MKIITLLENYSVSDSYTAKHGLSLYIESNNHKILFDVGPDDSFIKNASILAVDLAAVEFLIISHGHRDHCGGLNSFLEINKHAKIFMHKDTMDGHFAKKPSGDYNNISIEKFEVSKDRLVLLDKDYTIFPQAKLIMNYEKTGYIPKWNSVLYKQKAGEGKKSDEFTHEISLLLSESEKTIFISGCSHSGIGNMIRTMQERENSTKLDYLIGGFHLYSPSEKKLEEEDTMDNLVSELKDFPSTVFYTGHCTSAEGYRYLKEKMEQPIMEIHSGSVLEF